MAPISGHSPALLELINDPGIPDDEVYQCMIKDSARLNPSPSWLVAADGSGLFYEVFPATANAAMGCEGQLLYHATVLPGGTGVQFVLAGTKPRAGLALYCRAGAPGIKQALTVGNNYAAVSVPGVRDDTVELGGVYSDLDTDGRHNRSDDFTDREYKTSISCRNISDPAQLDAAEYVTGSELEDQPTGKEYGELANNHIAYVGSRADARQGLYHAAGAQTEENVEDAGGDGYLDIDAGADQAPPPTSSTMTSTAAGVQSTSAGRGSGASTGIRRNRKPSEYRGFDYDDQDC